MKKLFLFLMVMVMGCATATLKQTSYDSNGKVTSVTEAVSKRPIFAATAESWTNSTGSISSTSSFDLGQLLNNALAAYIKSQGIPVSTGTTSTTTGVAK